MLSLLQCELKKVMSIEWLDTLLDCINPSLDYKTVQKWLAEHMVPIIDRLEQVAYSELLAKHIERLARDYELSDKVLLTYIQITEYH